MTTLRLTPQNASEVERAVARLLLDGGVAVIPTDTVYGIAAHPARAAAVERLRAIKGRAADKPIALLAADWRAVRAFGAAPPPAAERLAAAFWPGALTLVVACGGAMEGFRVPAHAWTRALLRACGGALRVTSANLSGAMPAVNAVQTLRDVGLEADLVVDDGPSPGGVASTVVRVTESSLSVPRVGAISEAVIRAVAAGGDAHG
jgi:L-threonylcarbamoyladenylate synthase